MKIAFLLNSISRNSGGLFDACRRLAQTIAEREHVSVLGVEDDFTSEDLEAWAPLSPRIFRPVLPGNFGLAPGYARYLQELAPDIAHVHALWIYPSLAGYRWHERTKRPLIYSAHGMLDPWAVRNSGWKKRLVRALWEDKAHRSAACFHAISESEYRSMRAFGLTNPICVIPNGIDLPQSGNQRSEIGGRKSARGDLTSDIGHLTSGRRSLLYLGRLHPKKNLRALLEAWARVQKSEDGGRMSEGWQLVIAGWDQGGHEGELKSLTSDLGLLTSVSFAGPKFGEDKGAAYRNATAFILPSLSEGLPMVVLEAWAYGKPVLMTSECNLPEGFATDAALRIGTTPESIASGINRLMEMSDEERTAMGQRGRTLVAEKFSWPRIGEQMRAVYEWVLGAGEAPETVRLG